MAKACPKNLRHYAILCWFRDNAKMSSAKVRHKLFLTADETILGKSGRMQVILREFPRKMRKWGNQAPCIQHSYS